MLTQETRKNIVTLATLETLIREGVIERAYFMEVKDVNKIPLL